MRALTFVVALLLFSSNTFANCDAYALFQKFPEIGKVAKLAGELRTSMDKKKPFADLIRQAVELDDLARKTLDIREQGCGDADSSRMERCLKPVEWSCESFPPAVNFQAIAKLATTPEEKATLRFFDVLKDGELFHTCCNDFGCLQDGVGAPTKLEGAGSLAEFLKLALAKGEFAERARRVLEASPASLAGAKCRCPETEFNSAQEVAQEFRNAGKAITQTTEPHASVRKALEQIDLQLKKGFPLAVCAMPG